MQKFEEPVQNLRGDVVALASMLVLVAGTNTPATIFSDAAGQQAIADPRTDRLGVFAFYAPNGRYDIYVIINGQRVAHKTDVQFYDGTLDMPLTKQEAAATSGASKIGYGLRTVESKLGDRKSIRDFPGSVDGDDTVAILAAAASGSDIDVDGHFILKDAVIVLSQGQTWRGSGTITQVQGAISASPTNPNVYYGASAYPVFILNSPGAKLEGLTIKPLLGEGVQMNAPFTSVCKCIIDGQGQTWYDGINAYASDVEIMKNRILDCGHWYSDTTYCQRGEGIFLSGAPWQRARVFGNYVRGCGKNGLLMIGYSSVTAFGNIFHANRMSAVQIAFLDGLSDNAHHIVVNSNIGFHNGADAVDINNNTSISKISISSVVSANTFFENGWLYPTRAAQVSRIGTKMETVDGSGATLINIDGLLYSNNILTKNRKSIGYISNCSNITFIDNQGYKDSSASEDDTDGICIQGLTDGIVGRNRVSVPKNAMRIDGANTGTIAKGNRLRTMSAGFAGVVSPNGASIDKFDDNTVRVVNGDFINNPQFEYTNCTFTADVAGFLAQYAVSGMISPHFTGNKYQIGSGLIIFDGISSAHLSGSTFIGNNTDPNGLVKINNATGVWLLDDVRIQQDGTTAALHYTGTASNASIYSRGLAVKGNAAGNSIRVDSGVTASLTLFDNAYSNEQGFADYGSATRKVATYA